MSVAESPFSGMGCKNLRVLEVAYLPICLNITSSEKIYAKISGKGVHIYKGVGFALLILSKSNLHQISHENEIYLVSLKPYYLIFIGNSKTGGGGEGVQGNRPNALWIHHWF